MGKKQNFFIPCDDYQKTSISQTINGIRFSMSEITEYKKGKQNRTIDGNLTNKLLVAGIIIERPNIDTELVKIIDDIKNSGIQY